MNLRKADQAVILLIGAGILLGVLKKYVVGNSIVVNCVREHQAE